MPFEIVTVPCLKDNYAFLAHDSSTGATALVDAPEAAPILSELSARGWTLSDILITHHHWDHVDGLAEIVAATGARTWGNAEDAPACRRSTTRLRRAARSRSATRPAR